MSSFAIWALAFFVIAYSLTILYGTYLLNKRQGPPDPEELEEEYMDDVP